MPCTRYLGTPGILHIPAQICHLAILNTSVSRTRSGEIVCNSIHKLQNQWEHWCSFDHVLTSQSISGPCITSARCRAQSSRPSNASNITHLPLTGRATLAACVRAVQRVPELHDTCAMAEGALQLFLTVAFLAGFGLLVLHTGSSVSPLRRHTTAGCLRPVHISSDRLEMRAEFRCTSGTL
jgi:hypothetical protein